MGSVLGAFLIAYLLQRFLEFVLRYKKIAVYYGLVKQANLPLATLLFAFGFGSMPYYGFDYLVTKGFGFIPQEHFFKQTLFSPINLVSKTSQAKDSPQNRLEDQLALFFTLEGEKSKSFAVDTTPFDDGQYLKTSQKRPQAFEDLNYRGEHLWTNRLSRISNIREQANQTQSSFLGPIFSWMRSFLWGDEPGSILTNSATNARAPEVQPTFGDTPQVQVTDRIFDARGADAIYKKEFSSEMEENDSYLKEFDKQFDKGFSNFYDADPPSLIEVEDQWQEKRIKEKCYKNPIYKFLLNTEIDAFLARQPSSHWLSPEEEILLLKRRQVLGNYYDTLALTNQVSSSEALEQLVPKSYSNTIYNHQFKGTLKVARRLFSLKKASVNTSGLTKIKNSEEDNIESTLRSSTFSASDQQGLNSESDALVSNSRIDFNSQSELELDTSEGGKKMHVQDNDKTKTRVVKFDQPLFLNEKESKNTQQILFHEELLPFQIGDLNKTNYSVERSNLTTRSPAQANQISGEEMHKDKIHGAVNQKDASLIKKLLLEQAESSPLYAGWDEQLRKFIVTNKYQNRTLAGYTFSKDSSRFPDNSQSVTIFTTWPIPNPLIDNVTFAEGKPPYQKPSLDTKNSLNKVAKSAISQEKPQASLKTNTQSKNKGSFLFQSKPATNDMVNALLQWQKLMKENKPQETVNKQVAKEKISYWPDNIRRANWSNEIAENDMEFDEPTENVLKKKILLWEFIPPYHGGFVWSTTNYATHSQ